MEHLVVVQGFNPVARFRRLWQNLPGYVLQSLALAVLILLVLPVFVIIPISFSSAKYLTFPPPGFSLQWYQQYFSGQDWIAATIQSFKVGAGVIVVCLLLGVPLAYVLVRTHFRGKFLMDALVISPMILPGIILAIGDYLLFAQLKLIGTTLALILGHSVIALPFMVVNVRATLKGVDPDLERAAASLGAAPLTAFSTITLPLMMPGVIAGTLFAFITSFDEVVIALFISGPHTQTLPMRMWSGLRYEIEPTIAAVSSLLIAFATIILITVQFRRNHQTEGSK